MFPDAYPEYADRRLLSDARAAGMAIGDADRAIENNKMIKLEAAPLDHRRNYFFIIKMFPVRNDGVISATVEDGALEASSEASEIRAGAARVTQQSRQKQLHILLRDCALNPS